MSPATVRLSLSAALLCGIFFVYWAPAQNAKSESASSQEQPSPEKAKQQLLDLEARWLQMEDDPEALESILAADFLHVVGAGIITKDEQLNFMGKHPTPASKQTKHFEDIRVRVYGTAGIVNGIVVASEGSVTRRTLFTDVFAYRDDKWQAVNAQELPVPKAAQ